jgi:hypothetical protein
LANARGYTLQPNPGKSKAGVHRAPFNSCVDGHRDVFGKRAIVYGEADLVVGLVAFLVEIEIKPALGGSGGPTGVMPSSSGPSRSSALLAGTTSQSDWVSR